MEYENTDKTPFILVSRLDWDAMVPKYRLKITLPVSAVILRFTGTDPCTDDESCRMAVKNLQTGYVEEKKLGDIMYNFVIGGNGKVYEGTSWGSTTTKEEDHLARWDFLNIDVAIVGRTADDMTPKVKTAAKQLIQYAIHMAYVTEKFNFLGDESAVVALKS